MPRRKRFSEREVLLTLMIGNYVAIACPLCFKPVRPNEVKAGLIQRDHKQALALDGPDTPENCRYVHKDCHGEKTDGTKATSYGSDKHAMAKIDRLTGKTKRGRKRKIPSRPFPKRKEKVK